MSDKRPSVLDLLRAWWSPKPAGIDTGRLATRHLLRGHRGEALLCAECREVEKGSSDE